MAINKWVLWESDLFQRMLIVIKGRCQKQSEGGSAKFVVDFDCT